MKKVVRRLVRESCDTDLFNQSELLNLLLFEDLDGNRLHGFGVLCEPDLRKGSFPDGAAELVLADTALHLG
jgi:hypothetical protein